MYVNTSMECYEDMDLSDVERSLKAVAARLEAQAQPTRDRLEALGPVGLFAMAAAEQRAADHAMAADERRLHLLAARAAQTLAEDQVAARA